MVYSKSSNVLSPYLEMPHNYYKQMSMHNLIEVTEEYPPFTGEILTKYPMDFSVEHPEFMIRVTFRLLSGQVIGL